VKLSFESSTAFSSSKSDGVTAVVKYLQGYGKASTAYNDLRPFVECLSSDHRMQLLEILKTNTVFSYDEEAGTRIYPAKEDVIPQLPIRVYWIQMIQLMKSPLLLFGLLTMLLALHRWSNQPGCQYVQTEVPSDLCSTRK